MYKKHSIWDDDKWNIHSNSGSGYAGHGPGKIEAGYASPSNPMETYHKSQLYNSNDKDKIKDMYRSNEAQEEEKKKKEIGGKTLADAVQHEQKYQKKPESAEEEMQKKTASPSHQGGNKQNDNPKKKNKSSIEEAINDAIKEEKKVIHLD